MKTTIKIYEAIASTDTDYAVLFYSFNKPKVKEIESCRRFIDNDYKLGDIIIREYDVKATDIVHVMNQIDSDSIEEYPIVI